MKKTLYSLLAFATLLFAASCAKDPVNVADPAYGGKPVTTTFSVKLGGALTKADPIENSTLDDGTKVNVLYVGAYKDGALMSTSKVDGSISVVNKAATVSLTLVKGVEYDLVFFAEVAGKYTVNFADGAATFAYPATVAANDPELDAFYKTMKFTPDGEAMSQDVVLTRPFAQINVLVPADKIPEGKTAFSSEMTVTGAPTSFDLLAGQAVEPVEGATLTFSDAAINADPVGKYGPNGTAPSKWVGMNFVLVPEAGAVDISFDETDLLAPLNLTAITVKENGRTNLVGNIYGVGEYTFNVTVNEVFDSEDESPVEAEEVTYVIDDGQTYTADNPLVIDNDAVKSVSVTINGVDGSQITLSDVNAKPVEEGKTVTVSSSDENVATVALDGDAVKITPVANGDAVITISTPSFTKAIYAAATAKIYVKVTGMAVEPDDPELTVSADLPADGAAVSAPFTVTVTTNSTGTVSWTVNPETAATVAAGETTGTYTVTPATNLGADTPATVTFAVAAAEGFNAKTADPVSFTVAAAETPVTGDFTTIAELKEKITTESASFTGTLTNAVISFVPGPNDAVIKDNTASILYHKNGHGLKQGQTFSGEITVEAVLYNNLYTDVTSIGDAEFTGEEAVVEPEVVTLAQLTAEGGYAKYEDAYVKVVDMTSGTTTTNKGNINATQGDANYVVYTNVAIPINTGDVFTAEGTVTKYGTTEELKVWATDDLTITSAADVKTVISGVPSTKNLKPGESFTLAGTTNSGVAVSYEITTDAGNVASLSEGVVSISANATVGATVVITANAASSTGYTAADPVTCTITVVAADTEVTSYTLDGDAIKAAHTGAWSYTSGSKTITATDGSEWTAFNTYASTNQVTIQMNKGKSAYVLTPTVPTGKKITKITVVTNKSSDATGDPGDRPLDILSADGTETLISNTSAYASGLAITGNHSALRVICNEANGGATYIVSITIDFE